MQKLLNPSAINVFFKILFFQIVIGFLSLSVCHQFGINPFGTELSLDGWMMSKWGHQVCMFGCGIIFLGLGILIAGYFLTIEEVNSLKRTELLQLLALGLISLGLFAAFVAEFALGIAGLWLLGGLMGGAISTMAVRQLKRV